MRQPVSRVLDGDHDGYQYIAGHKIIFNFGASSLLARQIQAAHPRISSSPPTSAMDRVRTARASQRPLEQARDRGSCR